LFVEGTVIPFDIALVRGFHRTDGKGEPVDIDGPIAAIANQLSVARADPHDDSPIFQLIDDLPRQDIDTPRRMCSARASTIPRVQGPFGGGRPPGRNCRGAIAAEPGLGNLLEVESGVVVDLFLSLRDVKAHAGMIELYHRMPVPLQRAKMMREQLGFALNREGRFEEAEKVLKAVIGEFGPSSETNALLGRSYKDRWDLARKEGRPEARAFYGARSKPISKVSRPIGAMPFRGSNAVTLMEMQDKPDPRQAQLLPVVRYSATRKAEMNADYWDHATLMELAILAKDLDDAEEQLSRLLRWRVPPGNWNRPHAPSRSFVPCAPRVARTRHGSRGWKISCWRPRRVSRRRRGVRGRGRWREGP